METSIDCPPVKVVLKRLSNHQIGKFTQSKDINLQEESETAFKFDEKSTQTGIEGFPQESEIPNVADFVEDLKEYLHYCCDKCDYKVKKSKIFRVHMDENHNDVKDQSDSEEGSVAPDDFVDHDEFLETVEETKLEPNVAQFEIPLFPDEPEIDITATETKRTICCIKCGDAFETMETFIDHMNKHVGGTLFDVFPCNDYLIKNCLFSSWNIGIVIQTTLHDLLPFCFFRI